MKTVKLLFLLFSISIYSQVTQNIKGIVIDKQSEYPLPNTSVVIKVNDKTYGSITNFDGNYLIKDVPVGKINIAAHYKGFHTQTFSHIYLNSGKELVVNFALLEKLESLNEVVIKANTRRESVAFATTSAATFNVTQVDKYAGSLGDISRMAMNYAGVSGNDDSRNDIIVRGNNPSSILWVIDGAAIPSPNHYSSSGSSGGPVSMLNINTLSKSSFLSGAFPANFGNTTSAAFDLQFRKPNNNNTEFVAQIGFTGLEAGIEGPFSKKGKSSYLVNYRYSTLSLFDAMGMELGLGTAVPKYQDINTIVNIPTKKIGEFKVWAIAGNSKITFINDDNEESENNYFNQNQSNLFKENNNLITGITHKYFFNKKTSSKVSISYSRIDEAVKIDTLNNLDKKFYKYFDENLVSEYTTVDAKINSKLNVKNQISGGISYTNYGVNFNIDLTNKYFSEFDDNTGLASSYINWQHRFNEDLTLNTGLRYQYFTLNQQGALEPRIGLKYQIKNQTNINIAYGLHSNINPLLSYFTKQEVTQDSFVYANTNLGFVKSHHLIVGIDQKIKNILNIKAEVYYQFLFNVPISHDDETYSIINAGYNDPGGSQIFYDELFNDGKGKNYGLDLTLEIPLRKGFYTLFTGSIYNSQYLAYDDKWRNTAWNGSFMSSLLTGKEFSLNKTSSVGFDVTLNYAGGRRSTPINLQQSAIVGEAVYQNEKAFENQLPNYFRTDIKFTYKRNGKKLNHEWQLDLRNAFNRQNIFSQSYNIAENKIDIAYQQGILPVVQYRVLF